MERWRASGRLSAGPPPLYRDTTHLFLDAHNDSASLARRFTPPLGAEFADKTLPLGYVASRQFLRPLNLRDALAALLRLSGEARYPLRRMYWDDVHGQPFLDLHVDEAVDKYIQYVIKIFNVNHCLQVHPLWITARIYLKSRSWESCPNNVL